MKSVARLIVILIVAACATSSFLLISQWRSFYLARFAAYDVYSYFDNKDTAQQNFHQLMAYLLPFSSGELSSEFFSREDILHMKDVRNLFNILYLTLFLEVLGILLVLIVNRFTSRSKLEVNLQKLRDAYGYYVILLLVVSVTSVFAWQAVFELFHRLLFPANDYWQLDPASSNLIRYFINPIFQEVFVGYLILNILILIGLNTAIRLNNKSRL